ncbi:sensor histidine kinase [Hymenobacter baengnokdamensis]|uniref:sensor histidine kinase n=1 Tax=Hymenobacter baengnokdamensis TaxID=2615203 RepID=UPI0012443BEF|nr:HAMP domain-containing sensor histidine kinase [Hymenobacter baengnokdamensis]
MKTSWLRFAYPVTFCALLVSIGLQVIWLRQLFAAQTEQFRAELEHEVSEAAKQTIYSSLTEKSKRIKQFFMSDEWAQLRQAFDNMKINNVSNVFDYGIDADSGYVEIKFSFRNATAKVRATRAAPKGPQRPPAPSPIDRVTLRRMQQQVTYRLRKLGVRTPLYYVLYTYADEHVAASNLPGKPQAARGFMSKIYSFNLKHAHKYQAIVLDISGVVWYRMRYYLLSSVVMVLLTGMAFFFILDLLRKQRLYADAKLSFVTNMTHELKTPLSTVAVALESIVKYQLVKEPEKLASYINMSQVELHKLTRMIEQVLAINSELEGNISREPELLDIQELVREVLDSLQMRLAAAGTVVRWEPVAEPCFIYGHHGQLASVFYNLFDNALKYGAPLAHLEVSFRLVDEWVHIAVADDGPGMEAIYQEKVFERFFRIPSTGFVHNVRGSGLGLHSTRQTIVAHGGTIYLASQPGHGTTVYLKLKIADEDSIR